MQHRIRPDLLIPLAFPLPSHLLTHYIFVLAASATLLCGGSITYTATTPTYPVPGQSCAQYSDSGSGNCSLSIPQFNPSGGQTLSAITFTLTLVSSVTATGTNPLSVDATFSYRSDPFIAMPVLTPPAQFILPGYIYQPTSGSFVAPPGPFSYTSPTQTRSRTSTWAVPPVLSQGSPFSRYIGAGTLSLPISWGDSGPDGLAIGPRLTGPPEVGLLYPGPRTDWAAQFTVEYSYADPNTVPEPRPVWTRIAGGALLFLCRGVRKPPS